MKILENGLEVDFVKPGVGGSLELLEVKYSKTVFPKMAGPMNTLRKNIAGRDVCTSLFRGRGYK